MRNVIAILEEKEIFEACKNHEEYKTCELYRDFINLNLICIDSEISEALRVGELEDV